MSLEEEGQVEGDASEGGLANAEEGAQGNEAGVGGADGLQRRDDAPGCHDDSDVDMRGY